MAGGQERILRRRIRSIQSIRKTTRAMELISGSRIVRAQQRIQGARPYVEALDQLTADLAAAPGGANHRFLQPPDPQAPVIVVVVASDRGLSGAYNSQVVRAAEVTLAGHAADGRQVQLIVVGRKALGYLRYRGHRVDQSFSGMSDRPTYEDARTVAEAVEAPFLEASVGAVEVVSTRFVSMGSQRVEWRRLAPLGEDVGEQGRRFDYEMEPEREQLLDALVPQLIEARLFLALLEAAAADHAARQRAMKAATDNADELVTTLRRVMNRARQDAITTEIMDIVGGAEALRQADGAAPAFHPQADTRSATP